MRHLTCLLAFVLCCLCGHAQDAVEKLIEEGIDLHDRGYLDEAISKYDSVLLLHPGHYRASYEKTMTLTELKRYDAAKALCQQILDRHPDSSNRLVYVMYGTILDFQKEPEKAIKIYTKGIRNNPQAYVLYFNRAVTWSGMGDNDRAMDDLRQALACNPNHPGSHNLIALLQEDNKVFSLLADLVFLAVECQGERAEQVLARAEQILFGSARRQKDSSIAINLSIGDLAGGKKNKPDNFRSVELILSLGAALNFEEKYKSETPPQRLQRNLETVIASLSEGADDGKGFGWKYYAPFFIDLKKAGHLEAFSYMAYASKSVAWLKANPGQVQRFRDWMNAYSWPKTK